MYEFLVANPIIAIIFMAVIVVVTVLLVIKYIQHVGLEKIRLYAYKWFEDAENDFNHGDNVQKFEHVVQLARSAIPSPFNMFITETLLRKTIQLWFDLCKDLLDDGEMNGTGKK